MKLFLYDTLLEEKDICNLKREKERILQGVRRHEKMVIYGKRNTGKTSLVKSVVIPWFKKQHPQHFVLFVDLMQVKDLESISRRIKIAFAEAFAQTFPLKATMSSFTQILKGMRPTITIDPLSGSPSLEIKASKSDDPYFFQSILSTIKKEITPKKSVLLVFDEFQDISFVAEAEGLLRNSLQEFSKSSIILMGSKKHILAQMFAKSNAPFADFGVDIEFREIAYEEYHHYIDERFHQKKLKISLENARVLQDLLFRIPEPINIICRHLFDRYGHQEIDAEMVKVAIAAVIEEKRGRFEEMLAGLNKNEESILVAVAKAGPVLEPSSKLFLKKVSNSHATVLKIFKKMHDQSFLLKEQDGYHLENPLLYYYLLKYR
ncbi:MAG: hypothetical protein HQK50_14590 [Oligoflexia bacterium]|nr:hypothetical protein [Oligoflexia bacterium]MBF0366799.1 hypothetical protein [Oligoflexia bacterium]